MRIERILAGMLLLALAGCGAQTGAVRHRRKPADRPKAVSVDWSLFSQDTWADRTAPLPSFTPQAAGRLTLAFSQPLGPVGAPNESYPLEQNGILYVTGPGDLVEAISAAQGRLIWSYKPSTMHQPYWAPVATRGVALGDGMVYLVTADDRLIALDAKTGALRYQVPVADPSQGYFETMDPLFAQGKVIVGSSGGDEGVRGFVAAYDAATGSRLWQFYTVPAPGTSWVPATGHHGGGAVWTTPTFNPATGLLYVPVGNPSPDYFGQIRPGPNLYTDSLVALNMDTGSLVWYQQEVAHDLWDYDVASPPLLLRAGRAVDVAEAGKDGYFYVWNAATGQPLFAPVPFVKEDHSPPTPQGAVEWPGPVGGANYGPSAYDPALGLAFVAGINGGTVVTAEATGRPAQPLDFGTSAVDIKGVPWTGTITAVDVHTGKVRWQDKTATPPIGGVTAVSGGVLLFGEENGVLEAVSAATGKALWETQTGMPIASAPIVYEREGTVYVAVVTGGAASMNKRFPSTTASLLLVYRLGAADAAK
ncbi:MAG: PQQ-binding-like beta-propeller repeat protein [Thermaerobacter sp.]|nr:PQQ-binding-like beta-propeller repeat protein [Thermaerobacter sp.]